MINYSTERLLSDGLCISLNEWKIYQFSGYDVGSFLQGQLSNDFFAQPNDTCWPYARLDRGARLQGMFYLAKDKESCYALVPHESIGIVDNLNKYIISEDVTITECDNLFVSFEFAQLKNGTKKSYNGIFLGLNGIFYINTKKEAYLNLDNEQLEVLKDLSGYNLCLKQISSNSIINETLLLENAVSFSKGCYLGQETVNKIHNNKKAALYPMILEELDQNDPAALAEIAETVSELNWNSKKYKICLVKRESRIPSQILFGYRFLEFPFNHAPFSLTILQEECLRLVSNYFQSDDYQTAATLIDKVIQIFPKDINPLEMKAAMLIKLEKHEEAILFLNRIHEIDSKNVMAHTNKSVIYLKLGNKELAEAEKALATQKSMGNDAAITPATEIDNDRMKLFQEVLEIDADDEMANAGIGEIMLRRGLFCVAKTHLDKSFLSKKCSLKTILALNEVNQKLGDHSEAKAVIIKGLEYLKQRGDMKGASELMKKLH
jgi:folate-binding protein YgfZ